MFRIIGTNGCKGGGGHVVLNLDGFTFFCTYQGKCDFSVLEVLGIFGPSVLIQVIGKGNGIAVHGHQILHTVAPVNVQQLACRTHSMSGVYVSRWAMLYCMRQSAL